MRAICCDVAKEDNITAMFAAIKEENGGVDICVNNAGLMHSNASLVDGDTASYRNMLEVKTLINCLGTCGVPRSLF